MIHKDHKILDLPLFFYLICKKTRVTRYLNYFLCLRICLHITYYTIYIILCTFSPSTITPPVCGSRLDLPVLLGESPPFFDFKSQDVWPQPHRHRRRPRFRVWTSLHNIYVLLMFIKNHQPLVLYSVILLPFFLQSCNPPSV